MASGSVAELRAKWSAAELAETFVELVGDFDDDVCERIADWSGNAGDFVADARRLSERPDLVPSFAQVKFAGRLHARFVDRDGWGETVADELERLIAAGVPSPGADARPAQIDEFDPGAPTTATTATHARRVREMPGYGSEDGVAALAPAPADDDCDDDEPPARPARPAPRKRWVG